MAEITVLLRWKRLRKWQDFRKLKDKLRIINIGDLGDLCPELSHYGQRIFISKAETNAED